MKERERIIELVKQGVLSTQDALDLLESIAQKETRESVEKDYSQVKHEETTVEEETQTKNHEELKDKLEALANEASAQSVEMDRLNMIIKELNTQLDQKNRKLLHLKALADLDGLSENEEIDAVQTEVHELEAELADVKESKQKVNDRLQSTKKKQWQTQAKRFSQKMDVPEDWKENATGAFNQVGDKVTQIGSEVSKTLKETFNSVSENFDWTEVNLKVPSLTATKYSEEFVYPDSQASILDFKIANGNISFKQSKTNEIKIQADIKIYGKLENQTPKEAFEERSIITEDGEQLKFHVPNKRIRVNATVFLPAREYDYTSVNVLNGDVSFREYQGKDLFVKSTNGDMDFQKVKAVMLETKGTNGDVTLRNSELRDVIVHTINGDITVKGDYMSSALSTVNGTVRATLTGKESARLETTSVNGTIKIAIPQSIDVEGEASTNFGKIHSRLTDLEIVSEKKDRTSKSNRFRRVKDGQPLRIVASTTTGNILMKDAE